MPTTRRFRASVGIARHQESKRAAHREDTEAYSDRRLYPPGSCWCGQRYNHDWTGREHGGSHPRWGHNHGGQPVGGQS